MASKRKQQVQASENGKRKQSHSNQKGYKGSNITDRDNSSKKSTTLFSVRGLDMKYILLVTVLAAACGIMHRNHISYMFESDRHFSHLSDLERELAFRTEMGLYYSYFKTMIEAPTSMSGLNQIMYDNVTEYPQTINTLKRFNLYPEVVLGLWYRLFDSVTSSLKIQTKMCWKVNRGGDMPAVNSCEGFGDPAYFYIENVFFLNGVNMGIFFLFGTYLSGSIFGGALAVMSFFYNHGECTRVQWTPPLRESFAYPFLVIQMFIVTYVLKCDRPSYRQSIWIALATVSFMLPWQFAQFALMTQTVAVFACYVLQYIGSYKMKIILCGQGVGLFLSYLFLFGNEMLLTSFFASCIVTVTLIVLLEPILESLKVRLLIWASQGVLLLTGTVGMKILISKLLQVADDAHIGDIFRSKFSDFANFHTMLYTCAAEFDFMERETPGRLTKTLLLPTVFVVAIVVVFKLLKAEWDAYSGDNEEDSQDINSNLHPPSEPVERRYRSKQHAEVVYHMFQLLAYTLMALIIMRLKLFWTPHLCLMTSLLAHERIFSFLGERFTRYSLIIALMAVMSIGGIGNLSHQWSIKGEFSNYPQEELVEWIKAKTPTNAVFAGPMPTMATVKLCTYRPIVNHPHYEDAGLRERTKKIYSMYSRRPMGEVWQNFMDLQVDYAVLEDSWCTRRSRPGCGMAEIWDLEDKVNLGKEPICAQLKRDPKPYFKRVFRNKVYDVLQLVKNPTTTKR